MYFQKTISLTHYDAMGKNDAEINMIVVDCCIVFFMRTESTKGKLMELSTTLMENFFSSTMENPRKKEVEEKKKKGPSLLQKMQDARQKEADKMVRENRFYL